MAGACSHIAASLFTAQTDTELESHSTHTSHSCSWHTLRFSKIAKNDFSSLAQKCEHLTETGSSSSAKEVQQTKKRIPLVSKPNEEDKDVFYKSCHNALLFIIDYWL